MTQLEFAFEFAHKPTQGNENFTPESAEAARALKIEMEKPPFVQPATRNTSVQQKGDAA